MNLTGYLRKKGKRVALIMLLSMVANAVSVLDAHALTSGPSQPEVQSFEPAGTTDMVDMFTGDFTYNIPLFELPGPNGGYPFNLAYHAGITTEQEASWVGLGWNLTPGAINRQMRGLPDEFNGDVVESTKTMEANESMGLNGGGGFEFLGADGDLVSGTLGGSIYFNNYRGLGYSVSGMASFPLSMKGGLEGDLGLGFEADNQEGITYRPSLSMEWAGEKGKRIAGNVSLGFNSRMGLQPMSWGLSYSQLKEKIRNDGSPRNINEYLVPSNTFSSSLSFANSGFTPQVSMPTVGTNISVNFSSGVGAFGAYPKFYVGGYFNRSVLRHQGEARKVKAYGYMHLGEAGKNDMLDFNREADGVIREETTNLPIPIPTPDIYAISGQGVGGTFRVMRNDFGALFDQSSRSISVSSNLGVDVGGSHVGANLTLLHGTTESGRWDHDNIPNFEKQPRNSPKEAWYFQVHGEHTSTKYSDYARVKGDEPIQPVLDGLDRVDLPDVPLPDERKPRAQVVQSFTNKEIRGVDEASSLRITQVPEIDRSNEAKYPGHHVGAFIVTKDDGTRYVYALPAYNRKHIETTRGVAQQSDKELTTVPSGQSASGRIETTTKLDPFAYSYLLTAVIGPDYVDALEDGVSPDDLGYWVKFTYDLHSGNYKWRTPYDKDNYNAGYHSDPADDQISYLEGEKEIWYLSKAETKSHIATVALEDRQDALGLATEGPTLRTQQRIREIRLEVRKDSEVLQKVHFEHDYSLCPGTPNSEADPSNPMSPVLGRESSPSNSCILLMAQARRRSAGTNFIMRAPKNPIMWMRVIVGDIIERQR